MDAVPYATKPEESGFVQAVESLDPAELQQYAGELVAISIDPDRPGILASASSLEELTQVVQTKYGIDFPHTIYKVPLS